MDKGEVWGWSRDMVKVKGWSRDIVTLRGWSRDKGEVVGVGLKSRGGRGNNFIISLSILTKPLNPSIILL